MFENAAGNYRPRPLHHKLFVVIPYVIKVGKNLNF